MEVVPRLRPRPLEVACGLVVGVDEDASALVVRETPPPRPAVEQSILRALCRPPCLVSFSGGRDSSAVLATATHVARREGLPPPIPVSYRFAAAPGSHEDKWQEQVVGHVGSTDWERLPLVAELDTVGPVAQAVLLRHGLLWPFNAHFHEPLLQRAAGGSLLTGIGGDELFGRQLWTSARAVLGRPGTRRVRAPSVALALAPRPLRRAALVRRRRLRFPWLRPEVEAALTFQISDWRARTPIGWGAAVGWWWRSRYRTVLAASMATLAAGSGTQIVHPFMEPSVVGAAARHFGARGPADRSEAMRALFSDLLPDAVLTRRSKGFFDEAFVSEPSREFAARWDGSGVDTSLVDPERLAEVWRAEHPDPRSLLLMQAAWLARR